MMTLLLTALGLGLAGLDPAGALIVAGEALLRDWITIEQITDEEGVPEEDAEEEGQG